MYKDLLSHYLSVVNFKRFEGHLLLSRLQKAVDLFNTIIYKLRLMIGPVSPKYLNFKILWRLEIILFKEICTLFLTGMNTL